MTACRAAFVFWLASAAPAVAASAGCGQPPPDRPPQAVALDGGARGVLAAVPDDYDPTVPHRLIVAFHGRTNPAERVRRYYGLEDAAQRPTIVVYPRAERQSDGTFTWRLPEDAALFDAVVERMAADYCIDRDRIFAVGHSLGATFVNTLACARGETLRGVATVAGGIQPAECIGEAAALLLHHPQDRLVPVETGQAARDALLAANDLPATPAESFAEPYVCRRYGAADDPAPVAWCLHDQSATRTGRTYAHQWPDGAEEAALAFFRALEGD
ncbi:MAG: hypothetical protein LDL44_08045 [Caenispirillum sp.]|nr:hypothetical protein [Caenispirillum sp.]